MSVAEVRRSLAFIRKSWEDQQGGFRRRPFYLSDPVASTRGEVGATQSIERFALNFVLAHHTRRLVAKPANEAPGDSERLPDGACSPAALRS